MEQSVNEDTILAYTCSKYFVTEWKNQQAGKPYRFNHWAILFGQLWFFSKGMFAAGFVILFFTLLPSFGLGVMLGRGLPGSPELAALLPALLLVGSQIFVGFYANKIYLRRAALEIETVVARKLPNDYFLGAIKAKGGFNGGGFFLSLFLSMLLSSIARSLGAG